MAKKTTGKNTTQFRELTAAQRQECEKLAYKFYMERCYKNGQYQHEHGHDKEDWARAESVIRYIELHP